MLSHYSTRTVKTWLYAIAGIFFFTGLFVYAQGGVESAYRRYRDVAAVSSISVPTAVEVSFAGEFLERSDFAVLDTTAGRFESHFLKQEILLQVPVSVAAGGQGVVSAVTDSNQLTFAEFPVPEVGEGRVTLILTASRPITSSAFTVLLDNQVALPTSVEVRAATASGETIVVARRPLEGYTVRFPRTTSSKWTVTFTYSQLLRITELRFEQENATRTSSPALRFLAQPGHVYRIYFDPDRAALPPVGEAGNLADDRGVVRIAAGPAQLNPAYTMADSDADGVPDVRDNCVSFSNPDQVDIDQNGRGDVCDDFDRDGLVNGMDNCPSNPNRDQEDTDADRIGDVCDGEESRITERNPWLPWAGMGIAAIVLIALFVVTARSMKNSSRKQ